MTTPGTLTETDKNWMLTVLVQAIRREMTRIVSVNVAGSASQYVVGPGLFWHIPSGASLAVLRKVGILPSTTIALTQAEFDLLKSMAEGTNPLSPTTPFQSAAVRTYAQALFQNPTLTGLSSRYLLELLWSRVLGEIGVDFAEDSAKAMTAITELQARPLADIDETALATALISAGLGELDEVELARIANAAANELDRRERERLGPSPTPPAAPTQTIETETGAGAAE